MTTIIDGTVGANKGVVLDSNGKLPAIDGSQLTALNGTQVTTGTIASARSDAAVRPTDACPGPAFCLHALKGGQRGT